MPAADSLPPDSFARRLLAWFDHSGRHDLPWQHPRTPYRVWLSEIMLQQTQVRTAAPYFERFVETLPTLPALAAAPLDTVLALWSGLGYYARARNLHATARRCVELHDGDLPRDIEALTALPGIGRSTAAAILSQAWGDRHAILDGNVKRVLSRYHGVDGYPGLPAVERKLWAFAESHLPHERLADYTQAQMDLGATLCTRSDPACVLCPLQEDCIARIEGRVAELPTPKPGKPLPERRTLMLLACDAQRRVLLARKPPVGGVWAGLWSLPEVADHAEARDWLARNVRAEFDAAEPLPLIEHGFSHYRLHIAPLLWRDAAPLDAGVRDTDALRWQSLDSLIEIGLPAPVRKLLEGLN
ncbi:MAG TPA: A/G-specific adenine glycosylase [Lysobacter sp.]